MSDTWTAGQSTYWNTQSRVYDDLYLDAWHQYENREVIADIKRVAPLGKGAQILDLGCGTGLGYELLTSVDGAEAPAYTGVDISEQMLALFQKKHVLAKSVLSDAIDYCERNQGRYDFVMALFTSASYFSHEVEETVIAATAALNESGVVYLSFLGRFSLQNPLGNRFRKLVKYTTRGGSGDGAWAVRVTRRELRRVARDAGLLEVSTRSLGPLVGWWQNPRLAWLNSLLRFIPLNHTIALVGRKP